MPLKEHKEYSFANHSASGNGKIKGIQGSRSINRYFLSLKTKNCGIYTCRVIVISKQPIALRKKGNSTKSIPIKVEKKNLKMPRDSQALIGTVETREVETKKSS